MTTRSPDNEYCDLERADWREDQEELAWHVAVLNRRHAHIDYPDGEHEPFRAWLDQQLSIVERAASTTAAGSPLLYQEARLRRVYKFLSWLETADSWHSSALDVEPGMDDLAPLSVIPGYNDYERGFVGHARALETGFEREFGCPSGAGSARCLLFSSGMGAIHTALHQVAGKERVLLLGRRVYYETHELIARMGGGSFRAIHALDEARSEPDYLDERTRQADVVYVDSVSLDPEAVRVDLDLLFRAVAANQPRRVAIVLDNTVPGPLLALPDVPRNAVLYQVESLLKFYQGGLDLGSAGMLLVHSHGPRPKEYNALEALRSTSGTNINPYNARLLPVMPRWLIERRMRRHERNLGFMVERLAARHTVARIGFGGLAFLECQAPDAVLDIVHILALARGVRVAQSTGFGFNRTRICKPPSSQGVLRLAGGMESPGALFPQMDILEAALTVSTDETVLAHLPSFNHYFPEFPARTRPSPAARSEFEHAARRFDERVRSKMLTRAHD